MSDLLDTLQSIYTNEYALELQSVLVFSFIIWVVVMIRMRKKKLMYKVVVTLVIIYLSKVMDYTIFPLPVNNKALESARLIFPFSWESNLQIIPIFDKNLMIPMLDKNFRYGVLLALKSHFLNVIMFIPMGMTISFFKESYNGWDVLKKGFYISLGIEIAQLTIGLLLGASSRLFDVNDLIMNTLGAFIGYMIFDKIVAPLYKMVFKGESIYSIKD